MLALRSLVYSLIEFKLPLSIITLLARGDRRWFPCRSGVLSHDYIRRNMSQNGLLILHPNRAVTVGANKAPRYGSSHMTGFVRLEVVNIHRPRCPSESRRDRRRQRSAIWRRLRDTDRAPRRALYSCQPGTGAVDPTSLSAPRSVPRPLADTTALSPHECGRDDAARVVRSS